MKKRFKYWRIFLCTLLCLFCGCGKSEVIQEENVVSEATEDTEMAEKNWMTKEYIIEHGLATEEDLEGVDIDAMAQDGEWVEGVEETLNLPRIIMLLKEDYMLDGYTFNYQYLVDTPKSEGTLTESDVESIKTIGFEWNEGTYFASMIFDLSEGTAYFGNTVDLLRKGGKPTEEITLTDEQIEAVKNHVISSGVLEWQGEYEGVNLNDTDWFWWILYYELEDGSVYAYDGSGVVNGTPENYREFVKGLQAFFETEE